MNDTDNNLEFWPKDRMPLEMQVKLAEARIKVARMRYWYIAKYGPCAIRLTDGNHGFGELK